MSPSWYLWAWEGDQMLVDKLIRSIHQHHPTAQIIVIGDGSLTQTWSGAQVVQTNTPKWLQQGENFLHERYEMLLRLSDAAQFIKVDPDSEVRGPISPPDTDWFGQIFHHPLTGTAGCGMGLSRDAIAAFLRCPVEATDYRYTTVDGRELMAEDPTLAYYLGKAGYSPTPWAEVRLGRVFIPSFNSGQWKITHPSLRKRMRDQMFKRLVVDNNAPLSELEGLGQALRECKWRGAIYSRLGRAIPGLEGVDFFAPQGNPIPNPRMAHEVVTLDANGVAWVGEHCLGNGRGLVSAWYGEAAVDYRISLMCR